AYTVTFTASNALSGNARTRITVNNVDRAPTVVAPAIVQERAGSLISIEVTSSDPDGEAITSLVADLSGLPEGNSALFTHVSGNTSGTLSWTPGSSDTGSYTVTFTAANALSGSASTRVTVANVDRAPVVSAPVEVSGDENGVITVTVTASDPDADAIASLTADLTGLPAGNHAVFTPGPGNTTGTMSWTPGFSDGGSYTVTFTASNALSGSAS